MILTTNIGLSRGRNTHHLGRLHGSVVMALGLHAVAPGSNFLFEFVSGCTGISVRWPIYIINSVDKTKFLYTTSPPTQHHSFFRNYPFIHLIAKCTSTINPNILDTMTSSVVTGSMGIQATGNGIFTPKITGCLGQKLMECRI